MIKSKPATATTLHRKQSTIEVVAYSFSPYNQPAKSFTNNRVFLDILFLHPRTSETITLRTIAPAHLLCQSKETIEATVYREIRDAISFPGAAPAFSWS